MRARTFSASCSAAFTPARALDQASLNSVWMSGMRLPPLDLRGRLRSLFPGAGALLTPLDPPGETLQLARQLLHLLAGRHPEEGDRLALQLHHPVEGLGAEGLGLPPPLGGPLCALLPESLHQLLHLREVPVL